MAGIIVHDIYGRKYAIIDRGRITTLLRCLDGSGNVRIRSYGWGEIGFFKP